MVYVKNTVLYFFPLLEECPIATFVSCHNGLMSLYRSNLGVHRLEVSLIFWCFNLCRVFF
jgi:hypothetical protein